VSQIGEKDAIEAPTMSQTFACPRCGRICEICGSIFDPEAGVARPVYQCDSEGCQTTLVLEGQSFPAAYTFVVGGDGKPFDPTTEGRGGPAEPDDVRRN
jgi:rubredoxin